MYRKLKRLYRAANKNKLLMAMLYGAATGAGTAYLTHSNLQAIGGAALAGAVTAGLSYIHDPQKPAGGK